MKLKALLICLLVYLLAFGCAVLACINFLQLNQWFVILLGHLTATLVVFVASSIYKNSSFYDPFWSVAPIPIALYLSIYPESEIINAEKIYLFLIPILFWALRLTFNWIRRWEGLLDEDFRYIDLKSLRFSRLVDLFGIHIYPTLQVNLSLLPIYFALSVNTNEVNTWTYIFSLFTFMAVILELISDNQLWKFKQSSENTGKFIETGLWKYSRHPNYLGEVLFWWGIYFMTLSLDLNYWYLFVCPLAMNLMFSLKTCSMMDERSLLKREGYKSYMDRTNQLLILPKKVN